MTMPALKVEIAFDSGYATPEGSRTWTDVSDFVELAEGISISFGREDEFDEANPNELTLVLNNSDGRFTPEKSTSPYFPNVKLGKPIRVTATPSGSSPSVRFVGFIHEIEVNWQDTDAYAVAKIVASSRLARLGDAVELDSVLHETIMGDRPIAYYPLAEPGGAAFASDVSGNNRSPLAQYGSGAAVTFGSATGPVADARTAAQFSGGRYLATRFTDAFEVVECWFLRSGSPTNFEPIVAAFDDVAFFMACMMAPLGSGFGGRIYVRRTSESYVITSGRYDDGALHHLVWEVALGNLWIDGVQVATSAPVLPSPKTLYVGGWPTVLSAASDDPLTGVVAHVAAYGASLGGTAYADHADAASTGFAGEAVGDRLGRYASLASVPDAETDFESGQVADLAHIDTTGTTALACMREVELTEGGVLFDNREGHLEFHDRQHRYGLRVPEFTLDAAQHDIDTDFAPKLDLSDLMNDVTATNANGVVGRSINKASLDAYGPARESLELATTDPDEPIIAASWRTNQYGEPWPRVGRLSVDVLTLDPSTIDAVLAATIGTRFTAANLPGQAPDSTADYFIEGIAEEWSPSQLRMTFNVSDARIFDVWTVEDDDLGAWTETPIAY